MDVLEEDGGELVGQIEARELLKQPEWDELTKR
jgi:hypothetical protein